jgi:hypothetical protein
MTKGGASDRVALFPASYELRGSKKSSHEKREKQESPPRQ